MITGIYPNPAVNELNIELSAEPQQISIYNIQGRKVYSSSQSGKLNLNVRGWQKGIYLVETNNLETNKKENRKFVIE